jgi:phosphate transport system ATP-binding protein
MAEPTPRVETDKLTAMYGKTTALRNVSLSFASNQVHALIGPSGCGKSTFLRTLNRMHELSEGGWITGRVLLDGHDIYDPGVNAMQLRRKVGMVFQRPGCGATGGSPGPGSGRLSSARSATPRCGTR